MKFIILLFKLVDLAMDLTIKIFAIWLIFHKEFFPAAIVLGMSGLWSISMLFGQWYKKQFNLQ